MLFRVFAFLLAVFAIALVTLGGFQYYKISQQDNEDLAVQPSEITATPRQNTGVVQPASFGVISETGGLLRLSGLSEPNIKLAVLQQGKTLKQIDVDETGAWTALLPASPTDTYVISLVTLFPNGGRIRSDEILFRIPVQKQAKKNALLIRPALIMRSKPGGASDVLQSPYGMMPRNGPLMLGPIDYDDSGGAVFQGGSDIPGRVRIYADNAVIGDASIADNGSWVFYVSETLPVGTYDISVELMSETADPVRVTVPFERLSPTRAQAGLSQIFVKFEDNRWQVRRPLLGGGAQYTAIFAPTQQRQIDDETNIDEEIKDK